MEKHKTLKTLNMNTMEFNPEFLRMIRQIYQEKFKQMSLEYDPSDSMDFDCDKMLLTSLEGAPQYVGGSFYCSYNHLTTLEGAPPSVSGVFFCNDNQLTSLKGAPQKIRLHFYCNDNQLTSLEGAPQYVGLSFYCKNNQLTTLEGAPQYVGLGFYCDHNPRLSDEQINHYREFLKGQHQECMVDGHYMPPETLEGNGNA